MERMRRSSFLWIVVLVLALALLVAACGVGGETREPITTIQGELGGTVEEESVQLDEDEADQEGDENGEGDEGTKKGKGKGKDKGKAHGNGEGDDE